MNASVPCVCIVCRIRYICSNIETYVFEFDCCCVDVLTVLYQSRSNRSQTILCCPIIISTWIIQLQSLGDKGDLFPVFVKANIECPLLAATLTKT